jgi:hypothetical protein
MCVAVGSVLNVRHRWHRDFAALVLFDEKSNRYASMRIGIMNLVKIKPTAAQSARINPLNEHEWVLVGKRIPTSHSSRSRLFASFYMLPFGYGSFRHNAGIFRTPVFGQFARSFAHYILGRRNDPFLGLCHILYSPIGADLNMGSV